ncbi:phosphoserine phosphatase RsbU [Weizmannia acidilactici]|uniref:Phosphoserine phosphatase RsbU n=1 Tax=Weizmannia acidilactici TaxID=2607726 RepID=A0A5J4JR87_9BACI|nr:PP2C family protein-serine/threonine phosphatase [Weizmannia acidilactici]GER68488.1 phosphoserine phosphatase RsbU [Weizmannia acidilactici]GER71624.1 phosphoserine phosphatase RsbU [Weizmannia acidilactici]GER74981.1 phosphoserine phosphatase RsbU [Weizmannia acidilactici]
MDFHETMEKEYKEILEHFLQHPNEQVLYQCEKFSRKLIENRISPEDMIMCHRSVMQQIDPNLPEYVQQSFDVLLEVMLAYGLVYREQQVLRNKQRELKSEIEIAANMQQTLLKARIPEQDGIDIGVISVPAKQMSGDYYNFIEDDNRRIGIAIADVIGKGIPAALCMSMIKYSMDSLPEYSHEPHVILENLNRVVEQNVDPSMFVTMFYGMYDPVLHKFSYSSAGHEPGFYYHAATDEFEDLRAKGLLLGIEKKTKYRQYTRNVMAGDMIVLLSDGVTECRTKEGFISRETITALIRKNIRLCAQEIVENVYRELERWQEFELRDDFTLLILKRTA